MDAGPLSLAALLKNGPLVLIFFRFAGCPVCNAALPYYNQHLAPELRRLGATLVGVSPQVPQKLRDIKDRHRLDFLIATDADNSLGRRFGILYSFDEASRRLSIESGSQSARSQGRVPGSFRCRPRSLSIRRAQCDSLMSARTGLFAPNRTISSRPFRP
ncbi:redoxin domain-containing protein [Mesorhizobium sp.]|uniref:redoxin domain-containing protein n=1 Tax=Mesorhizobium sp. TaxID=1871066 RepID=UPI0025FE4661|nr:redoxin domain-containing protein [Mesorhizobium sp.]